MKTRLITWGVTLITIFDTLYGVIVENSGLLAELGVSPKITKIIMTLGILWNAFSRKLEVKPKSVTASDSYLLICCCYNVCKT